MSSFDISSDNSSHNVELSNETTSLSDSDSSSWEITDLNETTSNSESNSSETESEFDLTFDVVNYSDLSTPSKHSRSLQVLPPLSPPSFSPTAAIDSMETESYQHDEDFYSPDCPCVNCRTIFEEDLAKIKERLN